MAKSQSELINAFVKEGARHGTASNMYIEGDTLYSYGRHFPLLVRKDWGFLLNADKYSVTTSSHQSACFCYATIQIPFSALRSAGITDDFELVAHEKQRWDKTGKWERWINDGTRRGRTEVISKKEYEALSEDDKELYHEQEERRPESAVIKVNDNYYLSSMDGWNFFLCQLPEPVETVEEAFKSLKPKEVTGEYERQGEWFFVEATELPIVLFTDGKPVGWGKLVKFFYKTLNKNFVLPNRNPDGNLHIATRGIQIGDAIYVSGQIRHQTRWGSRGDHRILRLSNLENIKIFQAYENRALGSWGASGNVD